MLTLPCGFCGGAAEQIGTSEEFFLCTSCGTPLIKCNETRSAWRQEWESNAAKMDWLYTEAQGYKAQLKTLREQVKDVELRIAKQHVVMTELLARKPKGEE